LRKEEFPIVPLHIMLSTLYLSNKKGLERKLINLGLLCVYYFTIIITQN
jgi:hypothetical protein